MEPKKVIIIGAGPAGLAAGYRLVTKGFKVKILEQDIQVGGQSKSVRDAGYSFDLGGHRFYTKNSELLEDINIVTNNILKPRNRYSQILWNGKYYDYPLSFSSLITNLTFLLILSCFLDYLKAIVKRIFVKKKEVSFDEWVINRFGKKLYDIYFGPYTEKVWGMDPKFLSAEWASKRITILNLWDAIIRLFFKPKRVSLTYLKDFYYPDYGIGELFQSIADEIEKYGGEILLNVKAEQFTLVNNKITSVKFSSNGSSIEEKCDFLLSTAPVNELIEMVTPKLNGIIKKNANLLQFKSIVFLFIKIKESNITKCNWLYFPDKSVFFFRIIEFVHWSKKMAPDGRTGICCEIGCNYGDETWNLSDEEVFNKVKKNLEENNLVKENQIEGYFTDRIKHAYPVYTINYKEQLHHLIKFVSGVSNLFTFGRQGAFNYSTMDHSMEMGYQIADFISNGNTNDYDTRYELMFEKLGEVKTRF